MLKKVKVN